MNELQPIPVLGSRVRVDVQGAKNIRLFFWALLLAFVLGTVVAFLGDLPSYLQYFLAGFSLIFTILTGIVHFQCGYAIECIGVARERERRRQLRYGPTRGEPVNLDALRTELTDSVGPLDPVQFNNEGGISNDPQPQMTEARECQRRESQREEEAQAVRLILATAAPTPVDDLMASFMQSELARVLEMANEACRIARERAHQLAGTAQQIVHLVASLDHITDSNQRLAAIRQICELCQSLSRI